MTLVGSCDIGAGSCDIGAGSCDIGAGSCDIISGSTVSCPDPALSQTAWGLDTRLVDQKCKENMKMHPT